MTTRTTSQTRPTRADAATHLWTGAGLTAFAAVLFPRLNAVLHQDQKIWQLDQEAAVLVPAIVLLTVGLFASVGRWAWQGPDNRPARVGVVCGILALVGIIGFWLSAPIIFGGLALTLGVEGLRRAGDQQHRGAAVAATVLGVLGMLAGAAVWIANV